MNKNFCKNNFLYILCTLICAITGFVFASFNCTTTVHAQEDCYATSLNGNTNQQDDELNLLSQNTMTTTATTSDAYYCLTDENLMLIENQGSFGTCWIFAGTKALESYFQKTTGILYDFSEAWISLCARVEGSTKQLGYGGTFSKYYSLITKYGVMFEEEFPYEWLYNIDDSNYEEIYNSYKDQADKTFTQNLESLWFQSASTAKIKQYLINYGAMSISYVSENAVTVSGKKYSYFSSDSFGTTMNTNHSITLIGWDDNVSFSVNNTTYTGAYICLNNWGTMAGDSEVIYIAYNSAYIGYTIYGFQQKSTVNNFTFSISSSNSSVTNYEIDKYNYSTTSMDKGVYEDKSIFLYGDKIDVDYSYQLNNGKSASTITAEITKDGQDVTNLFSRHFVNKSANKYELETNKAIDSGRYFIEFSLDYDGDSAIDEVYTTTITIFSGAEMSTVNSSANTAELFTWQSFNKINSVENPNYINAYTFNNAIVAGFEVASYSLVTSVEYTDKTSTFTHSSSNTFVSASDSACSKNKIGFQINISSTRQTYEKSFTLKTLGGQKVTFVVVIYALAENKDFKTFVFFNNNGGLYNDSLANWSVTGKNYDITLGEPTNTLGSRYEFAGWYVDKDLTQSLTSLNAKVKSRDLSNYSDASYKSSSSYVMKYICVYAKWEERPFYLEGADLGEKQYGDSVKFELSLAGNGSGNYSYSVDSTTLPSGTSLLNENGKYYIAGNLLVRGDYSIKFVCYDIDNAAETSATYTLTVGKRKLSVLICDLSSVFGESLKTFEYKIQSGTIYGTDDLNIRLVSTVTNVSPIGSYPIYGTCGNSNYDVTFTNGTYKITKKRIIYTLNNYSGVYDGQEHTIELDVSQNPTTVSVKYSLDNSSYTTTPITEKNYTNGKKIIYIKLTCDNYEPEQLQASIEITQKQLTVVWVDEEFTYNGQNQIPSASVDGIIDNAQMSVLGYGLNAGNYVATASVNSNNYQLKNATKAFVIKKAKPSVTLTAEEVSSAVADANVGDSVGSITLPDGYEWANPTQKLVAGENVYYAKYTPSDSVNYEVVNNIAITISMKEKNTDMGIVTYGIIAVCGGLILIILISGITGISRKVYEKSCLDSHEESTSKEKYDKDDQVTIYFVTNSPIVLEPIKSQKRVSADLPKLERNYYEFGGWYTDKLFINKYKNNGTEKTITLYAKWLPKIYK